MLAGIIMQMGRLHYIFFIYSDHNATRLVAITLFIMFASEFLFRYANDRPLREPADELERHQALAYKSGMDPRMKISLCAMAFSTTCLFIRYVCKVVSGSPRDLFVHR